MLQGAGSTVEGLSITHFDHAILVAGGGGDAITGNFIGVNPAGTQGDDNSVGIGVEGTSGNTIGGTSPASRNLIAANYQQGILFTNGSTGNLVVGDYIGTNVTGSSGLGNGTGVLLDDSPNNTIGGTTSAAGNVIAANNGDGIQVSSADNVGPGSPGTVIQGNLIGVDATGSIALGNNGNGIEIDYGSNSLIGGLKAAHATSSPAMSQVCIFKIW